MRMITSQIGRFVSLLAVLCAASPLLAGAPGASLPDDCMPLSQIKTGMIGEARSVVHGFDLEKYKVEILGVEEGALPGGSMILARVDGPGLENHGIVAGMSGSPVFIDGKVIGAVAYGWGFAFHPYAGITPIEQMMNVWNRIDEKKEKPKSRRGAGGGRSASQAATGWDWTPDWEAYRAQTSLGAGPEPVHLKPHSSGVIKEIGSEPIDLVPLSSPIFISGATSATVTKLQTFFASRGLTLFDGGSSAGSKENPHTASPPMVAGSALGVPIMTGDVTMSSIGTVTYRQGNKLLAFGHPMFFEGPSNAPMAQAYMFGYMQSYNRSFKLGEVREIVGMIHQDRQFGIGGVFGEAPERVGVKVRVGGKAAAHPRDYSFSIWKNPDFLPQLAGIAAVQELFAGSVAEGGDLTTNCNYSIKLADGQIIKKRLRDSSQSGSTAVFSISMLRDLFMMVNNPYEEVDVDSITMDIDTQAGFRVDSLVQAMPRYDRLKPGDSLEIDTLWQPYRGEKYTRRVRVALPKDLRPGMYAIHLADGDAAPRIEQRNEPARFMPTDADQVISLAKRLNYPLDELRVYLIEPSLGLSVKSESMQGAPGSIETLMQSTAASDIQAPIVGRLLSVTKSDFDFPITARASFPLEVVSYVAQ